MRFSNVFIVLLLFLGTCILFAMPVDPDFGWHYRYGEYIVEHGKMLRENIFSYTFSDYKWANSYWISDIILFLSHRYLGSVVSGIVFALILCVCLLTYAKAFLKNCPSKTVLATIISCLLFVSIGSCFVVVRPMYFSTLFLILLIWVLFNVKRKVPWLLPVIFCLWSNMHADFILGLFVLGLYIGDAVILAFNNKTLSRSYALLMLAGILCLVVTLFNPYGVNLWVTLFKESNPYQFKYIQEWVPADARYLYSFVFTCGALGLAVVSLIGARNKLPTWYVLALGIFCIASVRSIYFVRIALIVCVPAVTVFWSKPLSELQKFFSDMVVSRLRLVAVILLAFSIIVMFEKLVQKSVLVDGNSCDGIECRYPTKALNYAREHGIRGNVFNYYGWGGYMIWEYPEFKTFIDGRMPSWREGDRSIFEDYVKVATNPKKNINILSNYGVTWIIFPIDSDISKFLKLSNSGWEEVYSDSIATIFVIMSP